jgi:hypothetical protein
MQVACSPRCAIEHAQALRERREASEERKARKERAREQKRLREAIRTPTEWAALAQQEFNSYINLRDRDLPCPACGQSPRKGARHAMHYRSRAAAPQLRFDTRNVHSGCAQCNNSKSGNIVEYRKGLVERIGEETVKRLEYNDERAHFTVDYLKRVQAVFRRRKNHLKRLRARSEL